MRFRTSGDQLTLDMIKDAADPTIYGRGRSYYKSGMVMECEEVEPGVVEGVIRGSGNRRYEAMIDFTDSYLYSSCTCPYDWSDVCKHAVALALEYLHLSKEAAETVETVNREQKQMNSLSKQMNLFIRDRDDGIGSPAWQYMLDELINPAKPEDYSPHYRVVYRLGITAEGQLEVDLFKARIGKRGKGAEQHFSYDHWSPANFVRDTDKAIINLFFDRYRFYSANRVQHKLIDPLLRLFSDEEYVFLGSSDTKPRINLSPLKVGLVLTEDGGNHRLEVSFQPETINEHREKLYILGENRPWLTDGYSFYPLATGLSGQALRFFLKMPQVIPEEQIPLFMEHYYDALLDKNDLEVKSSRVNDVRDDLSPRVVLYLEDAGGSLTIKPCFAYGDGPPQVQPGTTARVIKATDGSGSFWVRRQAGYEEGAIKMLEEADIRLDLDGCGRLDEDDALDFLRDKIGRLKDEGWEIVGEMKSLRLSRATPKARARIASGIDWFDLDLEVGYGDSLVDISTILAAYRSGRKYIRLDDGSWGLLPLDWLNKITAPLEELADLDDRRESNGKNGAGLKLMPYHIPLAEEILSDVDIQSTPAFYELRERLNSFTGIAKVDIPGGLAADLRDYQKKGLNWLGFLSEFSFNGILADDMGLGKTIQTLAHLLREKEAGRISNPSLIIAPTSVSYNWEEESRRFAPDFKVLALTGQKRRQRFKDIAGADIVITTYVLLRRDFDELSKHSYHYIILDEAQFIKNPGAQTTKLCKSLVGKHRLALTGTPLENNLTEVWSIFDFLMPGLLGDHKSFQGRYEKPIAKAGDKEALERLKRRLKPFILRRVKQDVATELPPKTETVTYCEMTPAQKTLYQQVLNTYRAKVFESIAQKGIERSQIAILDALLKLRQTCNHPQLLKIASNKVKTSGKMELFKEMVEQLVSEGHRALIFSQFTQMLTILREWLDHENIPYCYLDGSTRNRSKVIKKFNGNGTPLFLISLKAGGVGLNLTAADYVIHVDPWWNPAVESQATDRAYRIGQDKHVFVYKMITKDSIEEKILKLQERKKELFDSIFSEGGMGKSITREDLEELFAI